MRKLLVFQDGKLVQDEKGKYLTIPVFRWRMDESWLCRLIGFNGSQPIYRPLLTYARHKNLVIVEVSWDLFITLVAVLDTQAFSLRFFIERANEGHRVVSDTENRERS